MSKILILGASILQLPAIIKAKDLGHTVGVVDYCSQAVGIRYADKHYNISTIDIESVCKAAKDFRPDGILTLATDMPVRSMAAATNLLNLPGITIDSAVKSTDKEVMIKTFKENNIESPWYYTIRSENDLSKICEDLTFPCISKPVDNSGSRGVKLAHNFSELIQAFEYSLKESRCGKVILEEFLTGLEVSVEIMMYEGKATILTITDKLTSGLPYFVELGHSQPSLISLNDQNSIKDLAIRAVKAVGIATGPAHVEIMLTKNGPRIIELGARMGGDCISTHLVPLSTGIDFIKASIDVSLGLKPDLTSSITMGSAIRYISCDKGIIKGITGIEQAEKINGITEITMTKKAGDIVQILRNSTDRLGYVIAQRENPKLAIEACNLALENIKIITDNSTD